MHAYGDIERPQPSRAASPCLRYALYLSAMLALLAAAAPARAVPPKYFEVSDAHIIFEADNIIAKLSIGVDNITGLYEMLKDGASVELEITARLERVRTFWTNVTLMETNVVSTLQHNPLTREFVLYLPGETTPMLDKNLDRLLAATWKKFAATVGTLAALDGEKDTEYRVVLTLNLHHAKPPPWLTQSFMLWSKKIVAPETVELPFRY